MLKKSVSLTAGVTQLPCLSSSIRLIEKYSEASKDIEIIAYTSGYKGLSMNQ